MTVKTFARFLLLIVLTVVLCCINQPGVVSALSQGDLQSIYTDSVYYDPNSTGCDTASSSSSVAVSTSADQAKIAQIIIGVAKTNKLGKRGALVGLMVGLDESGLKIYANSNVPVSLSNPNKQAVGSDHDSLGVFQQRISTGWSTISSDPGDAKAVGQLMDPAYNAEAFFGSPPGSNAPAALSKGLQNHTNWQTMKTWEAAQAVQASGTPDGSNYQRFVDQAQSLVDQYYDSSPAVTLPVSIAAGSSSTSSSSTLGGADCSSSASVQCTGASSSSTSGLSDTRQKVVCIARQELELWKSGKLKDGNDSQPGGYYKYSQNRTEAWCADFTSWVYNQAGAPLNDAKGGNISYSGAIWALGSGPKFKAHPTGSGYSPRPGDLVVYTGFSHTEMVVANNSGTLDVIAGNWGNSVSLHQYNVNNPDVLGYVSPD
jgi:hypothetical protein